ncbi:MAG: transposase family protein [Candidatus Accumulibacter sp.]|nr:transposase family protein [Accumulibacter sp.]
MKAENTVRLLNVWVGVRDPRQTKNVDHGLLELLVVTVCAVLSGADTFVAIEVWGKEKLVWLRKYVKLESGIPCHDTSATSSRRLIPTSLVRRSCARWARSCRP